MNLLDYRRNVFSQNGEDGVIAELLSRLGMSHESDYWCVEFGAWDGKCLSNTFNLVASAGWNAVHIEGDPTRFRDLQLTAHEFKTIYPVLGMVGGPKGGGLALDDLLARTELPTSYDLLSIDIDSSDLDVWARHTDYRPRIVVIEINSSIAPGILQFHGPDVIGNSFSSTLNVASAKGYTLVCHTGNLIFVANELVERVGLDDLDRSYPERLFQYHWVLQRESDRGHQHLRHALKHGLSQIATKLPAPAKRLIAKLLTN